jgi:glycine betaine/proline transport system ATP-binding protein
MAAIRFEHVDVIFGDQPGAALALLDQGLDREAILERTGAVVGVHDAHLDIEEGEICVLMGLSGSGKSSLLRCVNGLNHVSRGRVLVDDEGREVDIGSAGPAALRRLRMNRISMVFQQFALMPWRTIRDNVGLGLELRGVSRSERARLVDEKLSLVRLEQWADKRPHELSGGMQQRVGLARALTTDADILLMDEPFSALDPLIREHLQEELLELQRGLRKTIVFVSHDLDEALKIGTHIAIMDGGRVVQYGTPESIVTRPANEYVRAFVANVNPLDVLKASSIMRPLTGEVPDVAAQVPAATPLRELVELLGAGRGPLLVVDEQDRPAGLVDSAQALEALSRRDTLANANKE